MVIAIKIPPTNINIISRLAATGFRANHAINPVSRVFMIIPLSAQVELHQFYQAQYLQFLLPYLQLGIQALR